MDLTDLSYYNSYLDIDLSKIGKNLDRIRAYVGGPEVIPVVKSNAYGLGTVEIARYLIEKCGVKMLAVARVFEACQILEAGCTGCEIMVLGPVPAQSVPVATEWGIQIPLFRKEDVELLSREAKRLGLPAVKAHLKLETGMNRIGVRPGEELADLLRCIAAAGNVLVDGVFTHFATADHVNGGKGDEFTREQLALFIQGLEQVREAGIEPRFVHCCNSGALTWLKAAYPISTHVRTGSLYLGYPSVQDDWNPVGVEESASWRTQILNLRTVYPGESVGYGRTFQTVVPSVIATIGVGYGDGYLRHFAVRGAPVLVNGVRCRFAGITMDQSFVDVTGVACSIGDEVTLFGEDGKGNRISGLEIGHRLGETRLAMFTHITQRVARVYRDGNGD